MKRSNPCRSLVALFALAPLPFAQEEEQSEEERGLRVHAAGAFEGYTLFTPASSTIIYLVDMEGEVVHEWDTDLSSGALYLLDSGNLLRCARRDDSPRFRGGGIGGAIQELDWEGNVVWNYVHSDDFQAQHHDVEPLPNGNVLLISWEHRFQEDAVAWGRDPKQIGEEGMWPDAVYEIRPTRPEGGEVVWEWHVWDHLIQDFDPDQENYGSIPDEPGHVDINADHRDRPPMTPEQRREEEELLEQMRALGYVGGDEGDAPAGGTGRGNSLPDWLHTNAVDYNAEYDLIVLSVPVLGEIWVIDHSTTTDQAVWHDGGRWGKGGDILYRWGNPRMYGAGDEPDQRLFYQHHPQFVTGKKPGELRILVFNNNASGVDADDPYSSVDELLLPFDSDKGFVREAGAAFGPAAPAWSYSNPGNFFSSFISGAQRLPNGNTLICSGAPGRVFEVTSEGKIVWDYLNPYEGDVAQGQGGNAPPIALFRATRIAPDHPGLAGREL